MALEKFKEITQNRHQYAQDWKKRTGGKVVGYFCTYVPEEILYAAGILPVRVLGSHEPQDVTQRHLYAMFCPFCRDVLAQGLKGRYSYLDGIVMAQTCIHLSQAFTAWRFHVPTDYKYYIVMPAKVQTPRAKPLLISELVDFKKSLEEWTGKEITDKALDEAIEVYNTHRRLLNQIYELRKPEPPLLYGAEAVEMVVSSQMSDKREHNQLLEKALKELPQRKGGPKPGTRLMIVGSEDDDTEFMRMVETLSANIVADEHCTGSRYFWNEVVPEEDRLAAIATRYLRRPPCPVKDWEMRLRFEHTLKLAKDYNVQGALLIQQKFCDPHEFDIPPLKNFLESNGIPCYFLEFDVTVPFGQFRTRVEAFLETLQLELV